MNRLIGWFAANSVAANLLMLFVIAAGVLSVSRVRQETYPNVAFDFIAVTVEIPGAAPDEVEEAVCVRIEEAIHGVHGIDRIFSRATQDFGAVWAKLAVGADPRQVLDEIKVQVDALDTLPHEAKRPIVRELIDDSVLLGVVAHGAVGEHVLRNVGEQLRDEIASLPEVSRTELVGVRPYEIALEVSEADLRRHRLSFDDVVRAVRASSVELAGGALKTSGGEILVRARNRAYRAAEFERLVLLTRPDGTRLALGDVARVVDGFEETDEKVRFDAEPAVVVRLMTSERRNVLEVSRAVRAYVESRRAALPDGVEITIWGDQSRQFAGRRNLMLRSGAQGLALMLLVLTLFLRFRLAFWVSLGIPISFLGAIIVLGVTDVSINMMSLFAFVVALGLVVDDSIIVGESVDRWRRVERDPLRAATAGAREVSVPVTAAVLSTVLFALPALYLPTVAGKIAQSLAVVLIASLVFSWVESLLILPAHLARADAPRRVREGRSRLAALQRAVDAGLTRFIEWAYRPTLRAALRWPLVAISLAGVTLMLAVALLAGGWVHYSFFPDVEDDFVSATLVMPDGTPPDVMNAALRRIEGQAIALGDELTAAQEGAATPIIEHVLVAVGDSPDRHDDLNGGGDGPHVGHVRLALAPGERRSVTSIAVADLWRDRVGSIRGAVLLSYRGSDISSDADVALSLAGPDRGELRLAADALKSALRAVPGVRDVVDSLRDGKPELNLRIRPEAEALGLTLAEVARQVRQGFHGEEVQRVQRGRDDVAVVVRYPAEERRSVADLEAIRIRVPGRGALPFSAVAVADFGRGSSALQRRDRMGNVVVTADVDKSVTTPSAVIDRVLRDAVPAISAAHPGVRFTLDGQSREAQEMSATLARNWLLALMGAYALLAIPLRSYRQPLIILAAVPFGFVGGFAGHVLLGLDLSSFSMIGLVALTGVVINDALILVDRTNRNRAAGLPSAAALLEAGETRFRPILLTSLTTFFGLLPLLFERSAQADWLKPMAVTLGFGVMFATAITLVLVPAAYVLLEGGAFDERVQAADRRAEGDSAGAPGWAASPGH